MSSRNPSARSAAGPAPLPGRRPVRPSRRWSLLIVALALALVLALALALHLPGRAVAQELPAFPADAVWSLDVSGAPLDPRSAEIIAWLDGAGGWGGGALQIDFSIVVLEADGTAPVRAFTPTSNHFSPDCDLDPVPVPAGGALEGESGYACTTGGDCHLIVHHTPSDRLYEMWKADIDPVSDAFEGGCLAVWDLSVLPGTSAPSTRLRGRDCTSADAAGLPIAPLLFTADEVAAGAIDHAIRFILPNSRIRHRTYIAPATHATGAASGPSSAPAYGTRLRLRGDFPLASLPSEAARTVARALQRYGMFLADGGTIALTAASDRTATASWSGLLGPHDLAALEVDDFEVVAAGETTFWTGDCERVEPLFASGFERGGFAGWTAVQP